MFEIYNILCLNSCSEYINSLYSYNNSISRKLNFDKNGYCNQNQHTYDSYLVSMPPGGVFQAIFSYILESIFKYTNITQGILLS